MPTVHGCPECGFTGYLLVRNNKHGVRIERCDACEAFPGDEEAVTYVFNLANAALDAGVTF